MKKKLMSMLIICPCMLYAQVVSQFTFESNPPTTADVGPDATGISSSATSDVGGAGGTNGLNAGLPKLNINMVIPGSPTFDLAGIDVSFDYHREESAGTFFSRGSSLVINGCANLSVSYRVDDGGGGFNTVTSGNVYAIPNDDTYRNYRFTYTPCDGIGQLIVDGAVVWSNDGPDFRDMYWTGAGDVTIGAGIDGTGNNDTFFDNLIIGLIDCSPLPVSFLNFQGNHIGDRMNQLEWRTASETNNSHFTIYKSANGEVWDKLTTVEGQGTSSLNHTYQTFDHLAFEQITYYKLTQTDLDGTESTLSQLAVLSEQSEVTLFPNPVKSGNFINVQIDKVIGLSDLKVVNAQGKIVKDITLSKNVIENQSLSVKCDFAPGIYFIAGTDFQSRLVVE